MIAWMKKVNNFQITKVQPHDVAYHLLIYTLNSFSLALLIKVLLIKKTFTFIEFKNLRICSIDIFKKFNLRKHTHLQHSRKKRKLSVSYDYACNLWKIKFYYVFNDVFKNSLKNRLKISYEKRKFFLCIQKEKMSIKARQEDTEKSTCLWFEEEALRNICSENCSS